MVWSCWFVVTATISVVAVMSDVVLLWYVGVAETKLEVCLSICNYRYELLCYDG